MPPKLRRSTTASAAAADDEAGAPAPVAAGAAGPGDAPSSPLLTVIDEQLLSPDYPVPPVRVKEEPVTPSAAPAVAADVRVPAGRAATFNGGLDFAAGSAGLHPPVGRGGRLPDNRGARDVRMGWGPAGPPIAPPVAPQPPQQPVPRVLLELAACQQQVLEIPLANRRQPHMVQAPVTQFSEPPGKSDARRTLEEVVDRARKDVVVADCLCPTTEMNFENRLDIAFKGPALTLWQRTARQAPSESYVGEGSRIWRRLREMLAAYKVIDAYAEWVVLTQTFQWDPSLSTTETKFQEFTAAWEDLVAQTYDGFLPQRVPQPSAELLWFFLMHPTANPPKWAREVAKEFPAEFDAAGNPFHVFQRYAHRAPRPAGGDGKRLLQLGPSGEQRLFAPLDEAARLAAEQGLMLSYELKDNSQSPPPPPASGWAPPTLCAIRREDGVLYARNGRPLMCRICEIGNHFANDCPHKDEFPCKRCGASDHAARGCPLLRPDRPRAPVTYDRPGYGTGPTYVTGVNQLALPAVNSFAVSSSLPSGMVGAMPFEEPILRRDDDREARCQERERLLAELAAVTQEAQAKDRLLQAAHAQVRSAHADAQAAAAEAMAARNWALGVSGGEVPVHAGGGAPLGTAVPVSKEESSENV